MLGTEVARTTERKTGFLAVRSIVRNAKYLHRYQHQGLVTAFLQIYILPGLSSQITS